MASLKYFATVHDVSVHVSGKEKLVKKGDAAPDGIDTRVRDALVRMGLLTASEAPQRGSRDDTATATADPDLIVIDAGTLPAEGDNRRVWEAFGAKVVDLSAADAKAFKTKPELVEEITKRFAAKSGN